MRSWTYIWQAFYVLFSPDFLCFCFFFFCSSFLSIKQSCTICYMYDVCTQFYVKNTLFWHLLKWYICDSAFSFSRDTFSMHIFYHFVWICSLVFFFRWPKMWLCTCETDQTLWSTQWRRVQWKIAASIHSIHGIAADKMLQTQLRNTFDKVKCKFDTILANKLDKTI